MANSDNVTGAWRPTGGARAYRTPARTDSDPNEGERGMSSVALRARKAKPKRKRESRTEAEAPAREKPEQAKPSDEGEQTIRKGIYLSALIWVEGDWPAARDFAGPAKAVARDALEGAFKGERDGLTLQLKKLEVRTDVEEEDGEREQKGEEKFEF